MKVLVFCLLVLLFGIDFFLFGPSAPDVAFPPDDNHMAISATIRKLKPESSLIMKLKEQRYSRRRLRSSDVDLEDYHPIDPAPSSKAKVKPGPIEHGTPLNPYIPRAPPPPANPKIGG